MYFDLRSIAIFLEVVLLAVITYSVLYGIKLAVLDLGAGTKYNKVLNMAIVALGIIVVIFFIAHLTTFYPEI